MIVFRSPTFLPISNAAAKAAAVLPIPVGAAAINEPLQSFGLEMDAGIRGPDI